MELFLKLFDLIFEDLGFDGGVGDLIGGVLVVVVPLLLEGFEGFVHFVGDEEVADEVVDYLQPLNMFRHKGL